MLEKQQKLNISQYTGLYDIIIPKNHWIRELHDIIDYEFIYEALHDKYCLDNGAMAYDPILLFKLLMLKSKYELSDRDLMDHARTDMAIKFFLDLAPEDDVPHHTTLTKFRKLRLQDETKKIRKSVYEIDETYKEKMPVKPISNDIDDHIKYCNELVNLLSKDDKLKFYQGLQEKINYLEEIVNDNIENKISINDSEARIGHKSEDTSFFGYKNHIAISPERIITAVITTIGDKNDGEYTQELIEQSKDNGYEVDTLVGDGAYSSKDDLEYGKDNNIKIVSKVNKFVLEGNPTATKCKGFTFNKDAGMYVCTEGHMAIRKVFNGGKKDQTKNKQITFYFDVNKCKVCPKKEGCYKEGSKTKSYTYRENSKLQKEQIEFMNSDEFKTLYKERYKIEAKNSELKNSYGLKKTYTSGSFGMQLQSVVAIFTCNLKRIITLEKEKMDNK